MVPVIPQPFLPVILGLITYKSVVQKDFLCCVETPQLGHPSKHFSYSTFHMDTMTTSYVLRSGGSHIGLREKHT